MTLKEWNNNPLNDWESQTHNFMLRYISNEMVMGNYLVKLSFLSVYRLFSADQYKTSKYYNNVILG